MYIAYDLLQLNRPKISHKGISHMTKLIYEQQFNGL